MYLFFNEGYILNNSILIFIISMKDNSIIYTKVKNNFFLLIKYFYLKKKKNV